MRRADSLKNTLILGKIEKEKGMTEDEMVGWHHRLNGHEFGYFPGVGDGEWPNGLQSTGSQSQTQLKD